MDLHGKLLHLFPDYSDGDWELVDTSDGQGPRIASWKRQERRPTKAELDAVTPADARKAQVARKRKSDIEDVDAYKAILRAVAKRMPGVSPQDLIEDALKEYDAIKG